MQHSPRLQSGYPASASGRCCALPAANPPRPHAHALTSKGRDIAHDLRVEIDRRRLGRRSLPREVIAAEVWRDLFPTDDREVERSGLAYFSYRLDSSAIGRPETPSDLDDLISLSWLRLENICDPCPRHDPAAALSELSPRGVECSLGVTSTTTRTTKGRS